MGVHVRSVRVGVRVGVRERLGLGYSYGPWPRAATSSGKSDMLVLNVLNVNVLNVLNERHGWRSSKVQC